MLLDQVTLASCAGTDRIMFTTDWLTHTQLTQNCAYNWRDDVYNWSNNTHTTNGDLCVQLMKYWYITDRYYCLHRKMQTADQFLYI